MSDENRRARSSASQIVVAFGLLVVFYVLSPFPVAWGIDRFGLWESRVVMRCCEIGHWPLQWLYDRVPAVERFYDAGFNLVGV